MKLKQKIIFIILLLLFAVCVSQPIHFVTSDLGRHLENGRLLFTNPQILTRNFYSYTNTDYPFINHHWASGVIFYAIQHVSGFAGLSIWAVSIQILTVFILFLTLVSFSSFPVTAVSFLLSLPILITRTDIRPELFSYLFFSVFLVILMKKKWLMLLPVLMIFWVNTHIYFPLGFVCIAAYVFAERNGPYRKKLIGIFLMTFLATIINPSGISGAFYPFHILGQYAYPVLENRSVFSFPSPVSYGPLIYFFFLLTLSVISWIYAPKKRPVIPLLFIFICMGIFSYMAIRNIAFLGFITWIVLTINSRHIPKKYFFIPVCIAVAILCIQYTYWFHRPVGLGLDMASNRALEAIRTKPVAGPIFNNYDIGSFLIYALPDQNVFVDNRPEAYPPAFFTQTYIPMQEGATWNILDRQYRFQTIIWSKEDRSIWSDYFLFQRKTDRLWSISYEDDAIIIFSRK